MVETSLEKLKIYLDKAENYSVLQEKYDLTPEGTAEQIKEVVR